jgi:hypothetical protein
VLHPQNGHVGRISIWAAEVVDVSSDRVTVRGEVWLGPISVGDCFTSAATATAADAVRLRLESLDAPDDLQEPGRVPRVLATLTGEGAQTLEPGVVLLGEAGQA